MRRRLIGETNGCRVNWAIAVVAAAVCAGRAEAQSFQGLGLPADGDMSTADSVSNDGRCVIGWTWTAIQSGAMWSAPGTWRISERVFHHDLSGDGSVYAGSTIGENRAVRGSATGSFELLPVAAGRQFSHAFSVSGDGEVIVGYDWAPAVQTRAVRWRRGASEPEAIAPAGSGAQDVNFDGSVIIGGLVENERQSFKWTQRDGLSMLPLPAGSHAAYASAVSGDGRVVVGRAWFGYLTVACRWVMDGPAELLGTLPGEFESSAYCVNHDGSVIAGSSGGGFGERSFIWTERHGMQDTREVLAAAGCALEQWSLVQTRALSADGRFHVGYGLNNQTWEGWKAWIVLPCSPADVATEGDAMGGPDGAVSGVDFDVFVMGFFQDLRRNGVGALIADIAGANGEPERDGFITGADFDVFLQHFFAGCE